MNLLKAIEVFCLTYLKSELEEFNANILGLGSVQGAPQQGVPFNELKSIYYYSTIPPFPYNSSAIVGGSCARPTPKSHQFKWNSYFIAHLASQWVANRLHDGNGVRWCC